MCFSSASYTTCSKQKSTLRTSSGHSFSAVNIAFDSTAKASANIIFLPFPEETGKLNEKQQLATFWSRLGSKLTNQKSVVFPERSSSWVENQMARLKCTKWLDHWKSGEEINSVHLWIFFFLVPRFYKYRNGFFWFIPTIESFEKWIEYRTSLLGRISTYFVNYCS